MSPPSTWARAPASGERDDDASAASTWPVKTTKLQDYERSPTLRDPRGHAGARGGTHHVDDVVARDLLGLRGVSVRVLDERAQPGPRRAHVRVVHFARERAVALREDKVDLRPKSTPAPASARRAGRAARQPPWRRRRRRRRRSARAGLHLVERGLREVRGAALDVLPARGAARRVQLVRGEGRDVSS